MRQAERMLLTKLRLVARRAEKMVVKTIRRIRRIENGVSEASRVSKVRKRKL